VPTPAELSGDLSDFKDSSGNLIQIYNPFSTRPDPAHPGYSLLDPFANNQIDPNLISKTALAYAKSWPAPVNTGNPAYNALDTSPATVRQELASLRIDEQLSSRNTAFVRYTAAYQPTITSGGFVGYKVADFFNAQNAAVSFTHTCSGSAVFNFVFGRNNAVYNNPTYYTNLPANFLPSLGFASQFSGGFIGGRSHVPRVSISGFAGGGDAVNNSHLSDMWEYKGDFSKLHGRHTFKMGADLTSNNFSSPLQDVTVSSSSSVTSCQFCYAPISGPGISPGKGGVSFASFLLGVPSGANRRDVFETEVGGWVDGFYFQDQWKPTDKLSVNLGLRYDFTLMPIYGQDIYNNNTTGDVDFSNGTYIIQKMVPACNPPSVVAPCIPGGTLPAHVVVTPHKNHRIMPNFFDNWQPRVGFAYRLRPALVLHGSIGRFFDSWAAVVQTAENTAGSWPQLGQLIVNNLNKNEVPTVSMTDPFAGAGSAGVPAASPFLSSGFALWYMNPLLKNPYSDQWTIGLEQQLTANTTLTANYVGAASHRLDVGSYWNVATTPGPGDATVVASRQPYPYIPPTYYDRDTGKGNYNAFQFVLNHRTGKGLSYLLSYTYSKNMSEGCDGWYGVEGCSTEDPYNLRNDRSVTGFDLTHMLSYSWVYQFPFGKGQRFSTGNRGLDYVIGNWQLNGIFFVSSGQPTFNSISGDAANTGNNTERPNRLLGPAYASNKGAPSPGGMYWLNPAAFADPAPYTFGTEGRNDLRMDWSRNFDLSFFRSFPFTETKRLEFRGEFFNAFNTPRFGGWDSTVGDEYFGQVGGQANSPRIVQFALKLYF
jgi:hypothetical protein